MTLNMTQGEDQIDVLWLEKSQRYLTLQRCPEESKEKNAFATSSMGNV